MAQRLDLDRLWRRAVKEAEAALEDEGGALAPGLPERCPFELEALLSEAFDFTRRRFSTIRNELRLYRFDSPRPVEPAAPTWVST